MTNKPTGHRAANCWCATALFMPLRLTHSILCVLSQAMRESISSLSPPPQCSLLQESLWLYFQLLILLPTTGQLKGAKVHQRVEKINNRGAPLFSTLCVSAYFSVWIIIPPQTVCVAWAISSSCPVPFVFPFCIWPKRPARADDSVFALPA